MKIIIIPNMPVMSGRHYCLAKTFVRKGHEIHYFMWNLPYRITLKELLKHLVTSLIPGTYNYENFTVHKAIRLPYFWPIINGWIFKYQLRKLYKKLKADIIITESYTNETEVPKDLPYIYDLADDYAAPADVYGSWIYKLAFKLLGIRSVMKNQCKNAIAVTAVSDMLCTFARKYNKNVIKVPNGVEKEIIEAVKNDNASYAKNKHSMIYVTGFGKWSRAIETLKTVVELKKEFPKLELNLIGKGMEVENIKKFIKENKAEKYIHYLGFIRDRKKVFKLINQNAIGLNISDKNKWRDAAHPMKVIEYSALNKKVISTDLAEVKALKLQNIYIFSDKSKKNTLKNVMKKTLEESINPKSYESVSKHILDKYSWEKIVDNIINQINKQKLNKIIHITPSYPPNLGGLEKVVRILATKQKKSGFEVSVITSMPNNKNISMGDNYKVTRLKDYTIANTKIMPGLFFELMKLNVNDIIHLHFASAYVPELVLLASKLRGFKYIAHLHLDLEPSSPAGILLKIYKPLILKQVLQGASQVVVFTKEQRIFIQKEYGLKESKIKVITNGVEEQFYNKTVRILYKKPRLLFVGRLTAQKNVQQLLKALQGISERMETTIVGDGVLMTDLKRLTKDLKLKNVKFAGRADGKKLLEYYKKSDIFVLPSEREGMPLVLLEAMAMGMPIIATDVIGIHDIVKHEKNGLLVPYGNNKKLQDALVRIISNKNLYTRLSQTSRKMADKFTWDKIVKQFGQLYQEVYTYV